MAYFHYDRLTALDSMFLDLETEAVHMLLRKMATEAPAGIGRRGARARAHQTRPSAA